MNFRTIALLVIAVVVVVVAARLYLGGHRVPAGQPPLGELSVAALDSLKSDFNRNSDKFRIILLLSPT
jgi:hypothetical protein